MISVNKLSKIYENKIVALNNVSFSLSRTPIFMVAGPNGAGKTTLLRILSTALMPTSGDVYVLGFDGIKEAKEIRKRTAIAPQDSYPDPYLTPEQFVSWYLISRGMSFSESRRQARYALEILQLDDVRKRKCLTLSGGERRRVIIAAAIATNAELLILDEPTAGLDPIGRRIIYKFIKMLSKERNIILSTHLMGEAEDVADKVLIINKGKMLIMDSVANIMRKVPKYYYNVIAEEYSNDIVVSLEDSGFKPSLEGDRISIHVKDFKELQSVISILSKHKLTFTIKRVNLDDVFIELCRSG
jgi:ABC-2 type transport system ATP-binding protein